MLPRGRISSRVLAGAASAAACGICGCVRRSNVAGTTTYGFELWLPAMFFFGGIAACAFGWLLRRKIARLGWILIALGPISTLIMAPNMFMDRVTVNNEGFTLRTGFWFYPTAHSVSFKDVKMLALSAEERRGRRGRKSTSYYLICHHKSGDIEKVPVGTLMQEGAIQRIIATANGQKIEIALPPETHNLLTRDN